MNNTSLINLGDLSKPASVFLEKISDAVGGLFKPWQIRRIADAEADAENVRAVSQIDITDLQHRAVQRFMIEEAMKQANIESIASKALPQVEEAARPDEVEDDWIVNFFDKCRLVSDDEMQVLWSKVLAGEANNPSTYSKRTVNHLASLDKSDAASFESLCNFCWHWGDLFPLIYNTNDEIYSDNGVTFASLKHLDDIGLINFDNSSGYSFSDMPGKFQIVYFGMPVEIEFEEPSGNRLLTGKALLSKVGQELASVCGSEPIPDFFEYVLNKWIQEMSLRVSTPVRFDQD